jgi:hypothetical protein
LADTLILPDVHLGSEVSHAREAVRNVGRSGFPAADPVGRHLFRPQFPAVETEHWLFLGYIRKLSKERRCNAQSIAPTLRLSLPQPATVIDNPFVFISDFGSFSVDSQPIHHPVITNQ